MIEWKHFQAKLATFFELDHRSNSASSPTDLDKVVPRTTNAWAANVINKKE